MNNKTWLIAIAIAIAIAIISFYPENTQNSTNYNIKEDDKKTSNNDENKSLNKKNSIILEKEHNDEELTPDIIMREHLANIASTYEDNIKFPSYSKPLSINDWNLLNPRAFIPTESPLQYFPDLTASIILPKYIHNREKDLAVEVHIKSNADRQINNYIEDIEVNINRKSPSIYLTLKTNEISTAVFSGVIPTSYLKEIITDENTVFAEVNYKDGKNTIITTSVNIFNSAAELISLGSSYVDNYNLIIPAYFEIIKDGNFRIQANVFDKNSGDPVSHINEVITLSKTNNSGLLKVHAATLRAKNSSGPYLIKDINITRNPSKPGDKTGYGTFSNIQHTVNGFDLEHYSTETYNDPVNQERLDFLRKISK